MSGVTQSLDMATRAVEKEMGQLTQSIFFFSDGVQRSAVDGLFDLLEPKFWRPTALLERWWEAAQASLHLSRFLLPGEAGPAWQELRNKLEVFLLVSELPTVLRINEKQWVSLPDLVNRAYSLSSFAVLWAVEGVGHYYADAYWDRSGESHGLLLPEAVDVPEKSLLMLHAGIGLSFAHRLLNSVTSESSASEIRTVVEQIVRLCRDNSREGYLGPAIESLGLVTREFFPDMVGSVHQHLLAVAPEVEGYFWHGLGRALYFSREYFLPVLRTVWRSVQREAPPGLGQRNAMAGLAWAATLVNMRQPHIMEGILPHIESSPLAEAFTQGVSSSVMMREDTTPHESFVRAFYQHEPTTTSRNQVLTWNKRVGGPVRSALDSAYPALKDSGRLGEIFRTRALAITTRDPGTDDVAGQAGSSIQ